MMSDKPTWDIAARLSVRRPPVKCGWMTAASPGALIAMLAAIVCIGSAEPPHAQERPVPNQGAVNGSAGAGPLSKPEAISPPAELGQPKEKNILLNPRSLLLPDKQLPLTGEVTEKIDSRARVLPENLRELPFSAIGLVEVHFAPNDAGQIGTGFLIAPGVVLTAAHVLQSETQGLAAQVSFTPGCAIERAGTNIGQAFRQFANRYRFRVSAGWRAGSLAVEFDYGAIFLPDRMMFQACGTLPLDTPDNEFFNTLAANRNTGFFVAGFPADTLLDRDKAFGSMWFGRGSLRGAGIDSIRHYIDTTPGQSGAPLFAIGTSKITGKNIPLVMGIHSRPPVVGREFNIARRIDERVIADIEQWIAEFDAIDQRSGATAATR